MMIEHVDAVIDLRRHQTLALGAAPGKSDTALAALRYTGTPAAKIRRPDWIFAPK